jgi:hypothetical protein
MIRIERNNPAYSLKYGWIKRIRLTILNKCVYTHIIKMKTYRDCESDLKQI